MRRYRRCAARWNSLPSAPTCGMNWGRSLAQRNQFADAEAAFKEALRLQPNLEQAHFHLGVVYLQAQQLDEAASELGKAIELAPQDAVAHYYLAKTLTAQSKSADALQELRKAAAFEAGLVRIAD